jgi:hypothetical protein
VTLAMHEQVQAELLHCLSVVLGITWHVAALGTAAAVMCSVSVLYHV